MLTPRDIREIRGFPHYLLKSWTTDDTDEMIDMGASTQLQAFVLTNFGRIDMHYRRLAYLMLIDSVCYNSFFG